MSELDEHLKRTQDAAARAQRLRNVGEAGRAALEAGEEAAALVAEARSTMAELRAERRAWQDELRQQRRERQAESPIMQQTSSVSTDPYATDINYDPRVRQAEQDTRHMPDQEALRHINLVKAEVAKERRNQVREQERRDGTLWLTASGDLLTEDRTPQQTSIVHRPWSDFSDHAPGGPAAAHTAAVPPWQAVRNMAPPRDSGFWREGPQEVPSA